MIKSLKRYSRLFAILSIVTAVFAVYWPSVHDDFVWDDTALILRDPLIRSWRLIPEGFRHFLFTDATASNFFRPVQRLTYTFDYALYAFNPWGYHFTNIILHAITAVAFFLCACALISRQKEISREKSIVIAWLAALVWAIHPVHSSAVIYVSGRADILAALFAFTGLYFATRLPGNFRGKAAADEQDPKHRPSITPRINDWIAALCFLFAILSKESGVTALIICVAASCFFFDLARTRRWLGLAAAIIVVYCGMRFTADKIEPPPQPPVTLAARPILMARAWSEYTGLLIAPANLHMERSLLATNHGAETQTTRDLAMHSFQTLLGLALITAFAMWFRWTCKRMPAATFFLVAFLIAYLPVSNLFPLNATAAEHWLYLNSAFLLVAVVLSLGTLPIRRGILAGAAVIWMSLLGLRTYVRNYDWKDQRTFLVSTMLDGGNSARMKINMGMLESSEHRQKIAIGYLTEALRESPDQPFALLHLATAYRRSHDYTNARAALQKALIIPFVHCEALEYLAVLDNQEKKIDRIDLLQKAANLEPENWSIQRLFIMHLGERGEIEKAISELKSLLDREYFRAESWELLGSLLEKAGRPSPAKAAYAQAAAYDVHLDQAKR